MSELYFDLAAVSPQLARHIPRFLYHWAAALVLDDPSNPPVFRDIVELHQDRTDAVSDALALSGPTADYEVIYVPQSMGYRTPGGNLFIHGQPWNPSQPQLANGARFDNYLHLPGIM
jgi:hypothetical protein